MNNSNLNQVMSYKMCIEFPKFGNCCVFVYKHLFFFSSCSKTVVSLMNYTVSQKRVPP